MLMNKYKLKEENEPIDKEKQKEEVEKALESIRRFNQINEEIKESYDKQVEKSEQRKEDMYDSRRKTESTYIPDKELSRYSDSDSSKDSDSSDYIV